ncbi:twin-arginine translocase subunit TatC [Salinicoccus hispanicus]|uniref:Sec-independent protein translocase protein TatC n=1 Tax=Salinicoccus hispanicus TaxID=157225 RepID=A0A6N8U1T1_9STAP|nr:twin-arginine translocase subunit TatC [Salinicoccus hispanicus]MXQ50896.1 twin-arginine translocase subunit TatC [Salinicoccus hispanicus]
MVRRQDPGSSSKDKDNKQEIDENGVSDSKSNVKETVIKPKSQKADQSEDDPFEPLVEQLESLRSLLIKSAVTFVLWFVIIFATVRWWFPVVSMGTDIVVFGPFEVIRFYIRTSAAMSLGLSVPFICWYLWQYVRSGLIEQKNTQFLKGSMGFMFGLFLIGIAFGYFVVHPLSYFFLIEMGERNFDVLVTADEYMSFLLVTTIPFGLIFQLPLIVLFLNHIELLDSDLMKKSRKFAYFGLLVITAIIAPPDFFTHIITLLPMIGLYELSIILVRRKEKRAAEKKKSESR